MWKEAIIALLKVLSWHFHRATEGKYGNLSQSRQPFIQDLNSERLTNEAGMLTALPCLVLFLVYLLNFRLLKLCGFK
jgi:hypothetical protein